MKAIMSDRQSTEGGCGGEREIDMSEHCTSRRESSNFLAFNHMTHIALKIFKLEDDLHPTKSGHNVNLPRY